MSCNYTKILRFLGVKKLSEIRKERIEENEDFNCNDINDYGVMTEMNNILKDDSIVHKDLTKITLSKKMECNYSTITSDMKTKWYVFFTEKLKLKRKGEIMMKRREILEKI